MRKLYRDTYSNFFDPATISDTGLESCQAVLMKMALSLQAPVLSLSQMCDSMPLLMLARDSNFLKILRRGIVSTSLFGKVSSLREFVESCLLKEDYIFRCFPFLSQENGSDNLSTETKRILLRKIRNHGRSNARYSKNLEKYEYFLDTFVEGVLRLDASLKTDSSHEMRNYRHNLLRTAVTPLSRQIKKNVAVLKNHHPFRGDPIVKKLAAMASRIRKNDKDDRTRYYNMLDVCRDMEDTGKKAIKELIDVSYNQSLAPLIAETSRMVVRKENEYANVLLQEKSKKDFSERYMGLKLKRVYDETLKKSAHSCGKEKKPIMPEELNDVLDILESCMKEIPEIGRERVVNYLYDRYCSTLEGYALSLEPDELQAGIRVSEMTSKVEQEREKYIRKTEKENGEVEFTVKDRKTKEITIREGADLDGKNTKKVVECEIS
jgi:hypothetical protein